MTATFLVSRDDDDDDDDDALANVAAATRVVDPNDANTDDE
jgi:hypothetical protein